MAERVVEVITVQVHQDCDIGSCEGEMLSTYISYPISPPLHEHACNICGTKQNFRKTYPHIDYRSKEQ